MAPDTAARWIRDGHMAAVFLDQDTLIVRLECPCPKDADYSGVAWDNLPSCRKGYDEGGQPAPSESPMPYCNFAEWAYNMGVMDCVDTDVTRGEQMIVVGPFPIGWRWNPMDEMYLWAPSTLIEKARDV